MGSVGHTSSAGVNRIRFNGFAAPRPPLSQNFRLPGRITAVIWITGEGVSFSSEMRNMNAKEEKLR